MRGHAVYLDNEVWRYQDTHEVADGSGGKNRECDYCGLLPEGYGPDPCFGWLPGVESGGFLPGFGGRCCGHGGTP